MIEPINHIGNIPSPGSYKTHTSMPVEHNDSNVTRDIAKTSSKYLLDDNKIIFERYDHNGKLISRVPWTAHSISEKANRFILPLIDTALSQFLKTKSLD